MINDLIPWVDRHFRTLADKDHRAMAGLSMGGGQTATITMVNLDKFSYIGFFSGGAATGGRGRGGAAPCQTICSFGPEKSSERSYGEEIGSVCPVFGFTQMEGVRLRFPGRPK